MALFHFLRLLARVFVFVIVIGIVAWIFIVKQMDGEGFREKVADLIEERLSAEEIELSGLSVAHGEFRISSLALGGGSNTFFEGMNIRNLRCRMGTFDRFKPEWDTGLVEISDVDMELQPGADSEASAASIGEVIFQDTGKMKMEAIQVSRISMRWGYSERTRGSISGSKMHAQKVADGWKLRFRGGTFSQNWLRNLDIDELDVVFSKEQIVFEKARFRAGKKGTVNLDGLRIKTGDRPILDGRVKLKKVDLEPLLPLAVHDYVEGVISAELRIFGSTNSSEGIGFEGPVELGSGEVIVLRDKVHILRALSVVDAFNNYRRLDFETGSFHLKSYGGDIEFSDLFLVAGDLFAMQGGMKIRVPTDQEATAFSELVSKNEALKWVGDGEASNKRYDVTLERAAEISEDGNQIGFGKAGDLSLFEKLGLSIEERQKKQKAAELRFQSFQYEGKFKVTLAKDAFVRAPELAEIYPPSGTRDQIQIDVPVNGTLYEVTEKQAEQIYKLGAR